MVHYALFVKAASKVSQYVMYLRQKALCFRSVAGITYSLDTIYLILNQASCMYIVTFVPYPRCLLLKHIGFISVNWTFYHCLYLQCHGTLTWQNDGLVTIEGLYYCNSREGGRSGRAE